MNPMMVRADQYKKYNPKIFRDLEPERVIYDNVDDLLAPETLHQLTGIPVTSVRYTPLEGGLAGSQVLAVETKGHQTQRFVFKRMSRQVDWIMQTSNDHACRSVTLWQHGLLDQLRPTVDHAILACGRDGNGWGMLMRDVSPHLMGKEPWSAAEVKFFLDALAAIHATFWQAPELDNPAIGLCDPAGLIQVFSVNNARRLPSDTSPVLQWIIEGWELLQQWLDPDVADALADLLANPQPLAQVLARYPATLIHGDYRNDNLALQRSPVPRAIVLDWQCAGRSAPTIDLCWFLHQWDVRRSSLPMEAAVGYYRQRLQERLGHHFDPAQWQPMLELGWLVDILRFGALGAWFAVNISNQANRIVCREALKQHNAQVRVALRWL